MSLGIGIVGLPNVGKSTLFNALTKAQNAESANYAFCTIEPNKAVVPVPDARLDVLSGLVRPQRVQSSTVDFLDIAGLVAGASKGEGLGNKFLGNIRETQVILHVVRCFDNDDVIHVSNSIDPLRDIDIIETELILADVQTLSNRIERMEKQLKGDKTLAPKIEAANSLLSHMNQGNPASSFPHQGRILGEVVGDLHLITAKNVIYCANVDEEGVAEDNDYVKSVRALACERGAEFVKISARMEEELVGLDDEECREFLDFYGIAESGLHQIIRTGFHSLGLISYFTAGVKEVRAWTIRMGDKAPQAAGVIHTDFERGFIRAEVIDYDRYVEHGSEAKCRSEGALRVEGKEYLMQDGDVVHFLFNV